MPTRATRWFASLRLRLPLPRTVRMRLTLLCGGVILLSGGALLGIAFLLGGTPATIKVSGSALRLGAAPFLPPGATGSPATVTIYEGSPFAFSRDSGGASGFAIEQATQSAARLGSLQAVHGLLLWALIGLGVVTAIGLMLGWALSGRVLRPLRTMRSTTQHISEENLHQRLALAGPAGDELKDLGDTIDGLLSRLEAAFEAQRRFVQNAAHELRTPITMMRTSLEVATGKPDGTPPEVTVLADKLAEGLDQAERLLEGFLALARAQAGTTTDRAPISLPAVVTAVIEERSDEIAALGLSVERTLDEAIAIGSATLVPQIVSNLIDNAIRHNQPGGWVRIATESARGSVRLVVENGGAEVAQSVVDELGRPFHRLVDRTASERGAGLGLSIVAAIVRAEGGTVLLEAREGGGLRVTVELTAAHPAPPGSR